MDHDIRALTDATNGMRGDFRELATEVRGLRELAGQVKDNTKAEAAHKAADRARQQITENSMKAIGLLLALPGAVGGAAGLIAYIVLSGN